MTNQYDSKIWANRSNQTIGNVTIIFPESHNRNIRTIDGYDPVRFKQITTRYHEPPFSIDREKEERIGRWVLNSIESHEMYLEKKRMQQVSRLNDNERISNRKTHLAPPKKFNRIEPIEISRNEGSYQKFSKTNQYATTRENLSNARTVDDGRDHDLSSFSSVTSLKDVESSIQASNPRATNRSSRSVDELEHSSKEIPMFSKPAIVCLTLLSLIVIVGIIIVVFVIVFVVRNQSYDTYSKDSRSIQSRSSSINYTTSFIQFFSIKDPLCTGEKTYKYYWFYRKIASKLITIRFVLQHDTFFGHWYIDDVNAFQDNQAPLIRNGGFEFDLTNWIVNISSNSNAQIYADKISNSAHSGSAYLSATSTNRSVSIEQTFDVIQGEYINISFWWKYDGGLKSGRTCEAIGELISYM